MRFGAFARTDSLPCLEEELQEPLLNLLPRPRLSFFFIIVCYNKKPGLVGYAYL